MPDYEGGSLVNLIASIVEARGARPRHAPLSLLNGMEMAGVQNLVLLLIDGLGDSYLRRAGAGGALLRHRAGSITSVFPSTTASAITTTYTGATPLEHGLTGWFTLLGMAGGVIAPLPFRSRGAYRPLAERGITPSRAFRSPSFFPLLDADSIVVTERSIVDSSYNSHHTLGARRIAYDGIGAMVEATVEAVQSGSRRKFVYAYWPEYDAVSHRYGCLSPQAATSFANIDAAFAELLERLRGTDTIVIATADHGFVDTTPEHSLALEDGPGLTQMLRFPLCGEPRAAFCHVREGTVREFSLLAAEWLAGRADVRPSQDLLEEGWFGRGDPHPDFAERIGDVALVMKDCYTIRDWIPGEPRHVHVGNHGGTSDDEMLVPLVIATTWEES